MYFTVNLAFVNYFDKAIEDLGVPIIRNWTTQEQVLLFSVESFEINASLLNAPKTLKELVHRYKNKKKILKMQGQKCEEGTKKKIHVWFFPQQFSCRHISFISCIVNNDYNVSNNNGMILGAIVRSKSIRNFHSFTMVICDTSKISADIGVLLKEMSLCCY